MAMWFPDIPLYSCYLLSLVELQQTETSYKHVSRRQRSLVTACVKKFVSSLPTNICSENSEDMPKREINISGVQKGRLCLWVFF